MKSDTDARRRLPEGAEMGVWRAPDGWAHRRMDWPQPRGARPRGSLLFCGGRGDFIEKYFEAHHWWHRGGWNVTAFDWRGQGGSRGDISGGHLDSLDPLVADLAALIESWAAAAPGPHVVVAHSMGGHVLLRALAERGLPIDAAALVAPMVLVNAHPLPSRLGAAVARLLAGAGWSLRPVWKQRPARMRPGSRRQFFLTSCPERYVDEAWWWQREPGYNLGAPSWGWLRAAYRSSARLKPEALGRIRIPLLFLGTDSDRLVSAAAIRRAAAAVPGAELMMFRDAGHEILRERDAFRIPAFERIDAFFAAKAPA